jgi:hypothetical protein
MDRSSKPSRPSRNAARGPIDSLAHLLIGALTEAAIFIAHADDQPAARREVGENVAQLLSGLRIEQG